MSKNFKTALSLYKSGRHKQALETIKQAHKHGADHFYLMGLILFETNRLEDAQTALYKTLQIEPRHKEAAQQIARIFENKNQPSKAIEFADYALSIDKKYTKSLNVKGRNLIRLGRIRDGLEALALSLQISPNQTSIASQFIIFSLDASQGIENIERTITYIRRLPKSLNRAVLDEIAARLVMLDRHKDALELIQRVASIDFQISWETLNIDELKLQVESTSCPKTVVALVSSHGANNIKTISQDRWNKIRALVANSNIDCTKLLTNYRSISPQQTLDLYTTLAKCNPDIHDFTLGLARVQFRTGAIDTARETLKALPSQILASPPVMYLLSDINLVSHNFREGWLQYFYRPNNPALQGDTGPSPKFPKVFVYRLDQGVGDNLLQSLLIPFLVRNKYKPIVHCKERLCEIFEIIYPGIKFVSDANEVSNDHPVRDFSSVAASAIKSIDDIKDLCSKVEIKPLTQELKRRIADTPEGSSTIRLGISWRSDNPKIGALKSIELEPLLEALTFKGTPRILVPLQYKLSNAEHVLLSTHMHGNKVAEPNGDLFNDLWAAFEAVSSCNFIVTCSNINAHIAGLLKKPCLLIIPDSYEEIWYWKMSESISDWYPTVQILRSPEPDAWKQAVNALISPKQR